MIYLFYEIALIFSLVSSHILLVRIFCIDQFKALKIITIAAIIFILALFFCSLLSFEKLLYEVLIVMLFQYNYFHLINLRETGRRVRLCIEIYKHELHAINLSELRESYTLNELVARRIQRLEIAGRIKKKDDLYVAISDGVLWSKTLIKILKRIFYGK